MLCGYSKFPQLLHYKGIFDSIAIMEKEKPTTKELAEEMDIELRLYEVSYLLLPFITEENLSAEATRIKEHVSGVEGVVFAEEAPNFIPLAYPMTKVIANKNTKFENAYFGWLKFEGKPESLIKLKKALESNQNVLRFLILKTTKDVPATRKPVSFTVKEAVKPPSKEEPVPTIVPEEPQVIDEAELDHAIEDLVIE